MIPNYTQICQNTSGVSYICLIGTKPHCVKYTWSSEIVQSSDLLTPFQHIAKGEAALYNT